MIISSGVTVKIDGWDHWESVNEDTPTILLFSHASTMDAFLLMAALPTRGQVMAKKELFYIPWFSWLLIAFGGVPVDRKRRSRAIESLEAAALGLSRGDCITLAPEGTRRLSALISFLVIIIRLILFLTFFICSI
jgi:1-acyl-sn-glycerol-3-phosphate acyltransferase